MPLACVCLTVQSTLMANSINQFMDGMHLNMSNSFTHLLDIESNEELNVIRHSPYSSDDELIESRMNFFFFHDEYFKHELSKSSCKI